MRDESYSKWSWGGRLENGESFYFGRNDELAVEKDFTRLVEPTVAEAREIEAMFPHLSR